MDEQLLIRFLTRTCTSEELQIIERWITADKANAKWLFEIEKIWSIKNELHYSDQKKIQQAYKRFIFSLRKNKNAVRHFYFSTILKSVAAIACIALLSFNLYLLLEREFSTVSLNTIEVSKGQSVFVQLADGTKVWLNAQSQFRYPSQFNQKQRSVYLNGEAYLEVAHDSEKPFIVHTHPMDVKVLGTKFNIRVYPEEANVVTLVEGKVTIGIPEKKKDVVLYPQEQLIYSENKELLLNENVETTLSNAWISGELVFIDKPLHEICRDLERRFDVEIILSDPVLANEIFTCRFEKAISINQIFELLKDTKQLKYKQSNKKIIVY